MNRADDMETLKVFSPFDGEQIGELNPVGESEMEAIMATAHRSFSPIGPLGYLKANV